MNDKDDSILNFELFKKNIYFSEYGTNLHSNNEKHSLMMKNSDTQHTNYSSFYQH